MTISPESRLDSPLDEDLEIEELKARNKSFYNELKLLIGDEEKKIFNTPKGVLTLSFTEGIEFEEEYDDRIIHAELVSDDGEKEDYDFLSIGLVWATLRPHIQTRLGLDYRICEPMDINDEEEDRTDDFYDQIGPIVQKIKQIVESPPNV
jgi:hypothetical protein